MCRCFSKLFKGYSFLCGGWEIRTPAPFTAYGFQDHSTLPTLNPPYRAAYGYRELNSGIDFIRINRATGPSYPRRYSMALSSPAIVSPSLPSPVLQPLHNTPRTLPVAWSWSMQEAGRSLQR